MTRERGAALLIGLLLLLGAATSVFLWKANSTNVAIERERITGDALYQAKLALIGYAIGNQLDNSGSLANSARLGDLPCPDTNDDGVAETSCGNGLGSTGQALRLGRLPWKTLGLPDIRDGSGERLWYAVSSNFKKNTRFNQPLNSDTPGTISVIDANGTLILDGASDGAIAIVIAPGAPLERPTSLLDSAPYTQTRDSTTKNNPVNYLEIGRGEDNADFLDRGSNGFISGPVIDATGLIVVNDRMMTITQADLAPLMEKRVVSEVERCISLYSQSNGNRLPWMVPIASSTFIGTSGTLFGRLPNPNIPGFDDTVTDSSASMDSFWPSLPCQITASSGNNAGWFANWSDQVFVAIANNHKPANSSPTNNCSLTGLSGPNCVQVDGTPSKQFAVIVAGAKVSGQTRPGNTAGSYLESTNATPGLNTFISSAPPPFNDVLKSAP